MSNSQLPRNFPELPKEVGVKSQLPNFLTSPLRGKEVGSKTVNSGKCWEVTIAKGSLGETFKPTTCDRCHQIVLAGIAEALPVRLDPTPLDQTSEVAALIAGRMTWQMNRRREVWWRSSSKIAAHPAGDHLEYAVFADHDCDFLIRSTLTTWQWDKPTAAPAPKEPAF
jgi:hypothetical protein